MDSNCVYCREFRVERGDVLEGYDPAIRCALDIWEVDLYNTDEYEFLTNIFEATKCSCFVKDRSAEDLYRYLLFKKDE